MSPETDRDVVRMQTALQTAGILGAQVAKLDPQHPEVISITGVPAAQAATVKSTLSGNEWTMYSVASQPDNSLKATMTVGAIKDLETRTLDTSIEVIRDRIDKLGVSEPTIQKWGLGENQILVELPGVSNPDQVEDAIQSTAKLAIHAVAGGPFASEQAALAANNNTIPTDDILLPGKANGSAENEFWLLKRASEVEGTDFRGARPGTDQQGRPNIQFTLTTEAGERFYKYTSAHSKGSSDPGSMAIVLGNTVRQVAGINDGIRDQGQIDGAVFEAGGGRRFADAANGRAAGFDFVHRDADGRAFAGRGEH